MIKYYYLIMGRFYDGDIQGKFWFGIQDSNDIEKLVCIVGKEYYSWKCCHCSAEIETNDFCNDCYESKEEHIKVVKEESNYEDESLYFEDNWIGYSLDKEIHYEELKNNMELMKKEIPEEIIFEFNKIEQNDKILDAFTKVFDKTHEIINNLNNNIYSDAKKKQIAILVARYTLGYQVEYCLRTTESCHINCEY